MMGQYGNNWEALLDITQFAHVSEDTSGSEILPEDVDENRIQYPFGLVLSDTSGAQNSVDIEKVDEDDNTEMVMKNLNVGANETRFLTASELGVVLPRIEGGTNLKFTAGSANVNVTLFYLPNEV